jgi:hypothetical protein
MDLIHLKKGELYLFFKENRDGTIRYFRATFITLYGIQQTTTMICHHPDEPRDRIVYHMNADNIIMAETLVTLMENYPCKLPDDVLNVINGFW